MIRGLLLAAALLLSTVGAAQAACPAGRPAPPSGCSVSDLDPVNLPLETDQTFWCQPTVAGCKATDPVVTTKQISFGTLVGYIRTHIQTSPPITNIGGVIGLAFDSTLSLVNGQLHVAGGGGGGGGITGLNGDVSATGNGVVPATVLGLQGRPVSPALPGTGQCLGWNGANWLPVACGTGSGLSQGITIQNACTGVGCTPVTSCLTLTNGSATAFVSGACTSTATNRLLIQTASAFLIQTGSNLLIQ